MRRRPGIGGILVLAIVGLYGARAVQGWIAGPSYTAGRSLASRGEYERALPHLERAAVGPRRAEALWLSAQVRLGMWQDELARRTPLTQMWVLLERAYTEYTEAIARSPALGWYTVSLGDLYHQIERVDTFQRGHSLEFLGQERWAWVGRNGRVGIGLMRWGIGKEPTSHVFYDQLALTLWDYGLKEPALEAVRRSADVLPVYRLHWFVEIDPMPEPMVDAFAEAARDALGRPPFLRRVLHLLALGRLELRRGRPDQAEHDFRAALEAPGDDLNRAEAYYYLGRILAGREMYEEALEALGQAERHPNFLGISLAEQGAIAERRGNLEQALALFRRARRHDRTRVDFAMSYARVARSLSAWDKAEEALKWASTVDPQNPRPRIELAWVHVARGDRGAVARDLEELERLQPDDPELEGIRNSLRSMEPL